jgi:hypothetical protein
LSIIYLLSPVDIIPEGNSAFQKILLKSGID